MSTPEEQLRQALGLPPSQAAQPQAQLPIAGQTVTPAPSSDPLNDMRRALGLTVVEDEEEEDAGMFSSFLTGAASGFTEPLTMVPYIRDRIEFLEQYKGDDTRDKVAHGLGWLAGSLVPGGVAFKIGSAGAKALRLVSNAEKAGEAVVELTRAGKLVRGGIAGTAWSVGQEADDAEAWAMNVATNAALFGVGDVAVDAGLRAAARWYKKGTGTPPPKELVEAARAANTTGLDDVQSSLMGRALSVIDDIVEREAAGSALDMESLGSRRLKMQLGVQQLGLEDVQGGSMKIIPSVGGDVRDITAVLDELGDFSYSVIKRSGQREGTTITDVLVGRKGDFDPRIAREFAENDGWIQGMQVIWRGKKRVVMSDSKNPGILMGFSADNPTSKWHSIRRNEMHILPIMNAPGPAMPDPNKWWGLFMQRRGAFPDEGFEKAFRDFTDENAIFGVTRERLKLHFLRQQREALKEVDPQLSRVLETVGKASAKSMRKEHPEGSFLAMAAEKGFLVEYLPREVGDGFDIVLRNQKNGTSARYQSQEGAKDFLQSYMVDPGDMIQGMDAPIGVGAVSVGEGVGVVPAHSALELSNFRTPLTFTATSRILPRESFVRRSEDLLRQQGITKVTYTDPKGKAKTFDLNLWSGSEGIGGFQHIREGQIRVRNELFGQYAPQGQQKRNWMGEIVRMRGGKRDLKTIRPEVLDNWWNIFEKPVSEHAALATKAGLNARETKLLGEARSYMRDMFGRILPHIDAENVVNGDQFVEQYLPFFRRMSSARWGKALNDTLTKKGKRLDNVIKDLMDDAYSQGVLGKHERDPFTVMARLTEYGLKKVHVERHYQATQSMLNNLKAAMHQMPQDTEAYRGLDLVQRSMHEYMNLMRGGKAEVHQALNVTVKNLFDQLDMKVSDVAFDRMINTMISLNYGAFMGFRLGQPLRNLSQTVFTVLPRVGAGNLAKGIESTFKNPRAAMREATEAGVRVERGLALAMDDVITTKEIASMTGQTDKKFTRGAMAVGERLEDLSNFSLGGEVTIGGVKVPVGLFNASDEWQRVVAFFSQKHKTIAAINNWKTKKWSVDKFNEEAGLTQFGESITAEFHRRMTANQDDAIKFVSTLLSDDTHFMYQLGAGPAWMAHGVGRMLGQYGTWPAWYAEHMRKGLSQGTKNDRIRFMGWTAAAHAAIVGVGYETGINLSRWTGLSSFGWAGGPFFDWAKDATSIWGGLQADGRPTAARQLALGQYGLTDVGPESGLVGGAQNMIPGGPTQVRVKDPYKLFESTVGMFTPGMYMIRDAMKVAEQMQNGQSGEAMIQAFGLRRAETIGNTWPEINFSGNR